MAQFTASLLIAAPIERVFDAVAHIERFREVVPRITNVEFLSERRTGVGTRFRETRRMGRREATTVLEVTEYVPNEHVRLVADEGGTIWDTVLTVRPNGDATELAMVMDARPHTLLARFLTPFIRRPVGKAIAADLDALKAFCEARDA